MAPFIRMMGVYPPGSVVQLTDDRFALVTSVNSARPLKPKVLVHDARVPSSEAAARPARPQRVWLTWRLHEGPGLS